MDYLLIDGYNIINDWNDVFDLKNKTLEENRLKLIDIMSNYQGHTNYNIVIVFDAHMVKEGLGSIENYDNIKVVYTKENQTADNFIERFVNSVNDGRILMVATNDYMEQKTVLMKGGLRISARELKQDVLSANRKQSEYNYEVKDKNFLEDHLPDDIKSVFEALRRKVQE